MNQITNKKPTLQKSSVHAESVRVGIRLAFLANGQPLPPPDVVDRIMAMGKDQLDAHEFPLELVANQTAVLRDLRRTYAIKAMEVLLHKAGEYGADEQLEKIADQAWTVAAHMERHDNSSLAMDSIKGRR
jgi:hypothetical protein